MPGCPRFGSLPGPGIQTPYIPLLKDRMASVDHLNLPSPLQHENYNSATQTIPERLRLLEDQTLPISHLNPPSPHQLQTTYRPQQHQHCQSACIYSRAEPHQSTTSTSVTKSTCKLRTLLSNANTAQAPALTRRPKPPIDDLSRCRQIRVQTMYGNSTAQAPTFA